MFFIKPVKAISSHQKTVISNEVLSIKQINNYEVYQSELHNLHPKCLICWQTLTELSQHCIIANRRIESFSIYENNKKRMEAKPFVFKTKKPFVFKNALVLFFRIIFNLILTFVVTPLYLLFWVFKDPYKDFFCLKHYDVRPIKLERIRRWVIYFIACFFWTVIVVAILIIILWKYNFL